MNNHDLQRFWEFAQAYQKFHVYFWALSLTASASLLLVTNPLFSPIVIVILFTVYLFYQIKMGWTDNKIRNLLLYKQLTREPFSPLEQETVDRYFGKYQRKQIILEDIMKRKWSRIVMGIDIGCLTIIGVSIYLIIL